MKIFHFLLTLLLFLPFYSCGRPDRAEREAKINSPPVIKSVAILPENPTVVKDIVASVQGEDSDQDPITFFYQWIKNDEEMAGEKKNILNSGSFKKGDILQVRVVPSDGKEDGKPFLSNPVKVLNSPPVLQEVKIEPRVASASDELKAVVKGVDQDGDFIYYAYRWEKNGVIIPEEDREVLQRNRFKKGDSIAVTATPDDREVVGTPKKSEAINISNSPPIIVSSPPISIEKSTYLYQVKVNDPDNDPVKFVLKSGPKGMEIDKNTGLVRWEIRKEDKGTHQVEIEASDNEGAKSNQKFVISVDVKESQ
jgi:hypothetical protein